MNLSFSFSPTVKIIQRINDIIDHFVQLYAIFSVETSIYRLNRDIRFFTVFLYEHACVYVYSIVVIC